MKLTKRQHEILNYIKEYTKDHDYAPSYREIGEHFGLSSPATVHQHVETLIKKGLLEKDGNVRALSLSQTLKSLGKALRLPLAGLITAGAPIEAVEQKEEIDVPADLVTDAGKSFVLKVQGDSMIEDGILDGDFVIVEQRQIARDGEVVVALIDNQYATLKRFYQEKKRIRLQPANHTMNPIYVDHVNIQGIVKGLMRKI